MKIKISEITIHKGRRDVDYVKVSELAESIRIVGLINPITVDKNNTLIAGAHRLEACKTLGVDEIECVVLDSDELRIELAEIDENFIRCELDDIAIGKLANRRDEILEALGLRRKVGGDGGNQHKKSNGESASPLQTTADIARQMGISERILQQNKQLARDLVPEAQEAVKEKKMTKKDALAVSRLEPKKQREAVQQIENGKKYKPEKSAKRKTIAEARDEEDHIKVEQKWSEHVKTMISWWDVMPKAYRQLTDGEEMTGSMQVPVPFHHNMILAMFRKMCDDAGEDGDELRKNLIAEVKLLADRIEELNY